MKYDWLLALPLIVTAAISGVFLAQLVLNRGDLARGGDSAALPSTRAGSVAPDLDLQPLAQLPGLTRADLEGNGLVIVNFFASWCVPCRAEHPTLTALAEAGNPLFGVNYRDAPADALGFLSDLGNPYDLIGADPEARTGREWGVAAMPETFFINDEGIVVLHLRGPVLRRSLRNQVIPALAEAGYTLRGAEAIAQQ